MVFFGAKRLGNSLGPTRWCWASGPHGPCIQMYALCSPLLAKTHGGWGAGGLITFLGLDMGRRNHQGRNFYFFSLLLELLIVHPQSCFEDLSHCIRPAFFGVVAAQPVSCTLKLGPICWHVCPDFWYSSQLFYAASTNINFVWTC